jgi:23S rRNA pseudouridine2605 synthase/16S rRNA pseudouridine516 synthase
LVRRQFGPLHLGTLGSGRIRDLTRVELGQLLTLSRGAGPDEAEPGDTSGPDAADDPE